MRKLSIIGISISAVGGFFLILIGIVTVEISQYYEKCGGACAGASVNPIFVIIVLILIPLGIYILIVSKIKVDL
ncbi:MAG TPA: hypothetical protein VFG24_09345 [Nitrosopumilaceae archaeon]|nr:hypothetical protein [Nitrosopumilaceae archaeon]